MSIEDKTQANAFGGGGSEELERLNQGDSDEFGEEMNVSGKSILSFTHLNADPSHQSTSLQAFFSLFKSFIGSGVLTLPYSFKNSGLGVSIVVTTILGLLTYYCTTLIVDVADSKKGKDNEKISYGRLAYNEMKIYGMYSVKIGLIIMQMGVCIGIFILVNNFLEHAFCTFNIVELCGNRTFNVMLCVVLTIPLCFINNLHYFYIPNFMGFLFLVIGLSTQVYYDIELANISPNFSETTLANFRKFDLPKVPLLFGVVIFAFEGIGTVFEIRSSMKKPKDFSKLLKVSLIILTVIYIIFPIICVLALNDNLPEIVLFTLPKNNSFYLLVQVGYVFSALLSYPTQFYPAMKIVENLSFLKYRIFEKSDGTTKNPYLRYGIRIALICLMLFIANVTKSFNLFLNFLGSFVFTYLGYILPLWIYEIHFKDELKTYQKVFNVLSFIVAAFCGITGVIVTLIAFVNYRG